MKKSFDKIYKEIVDIIAEKGIWSEGNVRTKYADGTAAHYKSYIGYQFRLDNSGDEAHLITSRFAPSKAAIRELYWIWILQSNNVDVLDKLGCKFWDEWAIQETDFTLKYIEKKDIEMNTEKIDIKINDLINKDCEVKKNKQGQEYYLLEYLGKSKGYEKPKYKIQFKNTGNIKIINAGCAYSGEVKDEFERSVAKIGYYGNYKSKEIIEYFGEFHSKWVVKWENMIRRCSGIYSGNKKLYVNTKIDNYFHSCENFLLWVIKNNRYGKEKLDILQIDKDYYGCNYYGPETCTLLTPKENTFLTQKYWFLDYETQTLFPSMIELVTKFKTYFNNLKIYSKNKKIKSLNEIKTIKFDYKIIEEGIKNLIKENKILIIQNQETKNMFPRFELKPKRTIKLAYGYQIAQETFGQKSQLHYVINELKKNPNSRRIMTEIWVPNELSEMALTPCVHLTQWSVIGNKLYLEVRQRSCDVALGLVANVFQYSVLHKLVALECGLEPAEIIWNIHNVHIYDRHYDKLIKQVNEETFEPAKIKINNFKSIFDFKPDDVEIINYKHGEKISYEVAI